jgi:hypothetical protein
LDVSKESLETSELLANITVKTEFLDSALKFHLAIAYAMGFPVHNLSVAARALSGIVGATTVNFVRQMARHANYIRHRPLDVFSRPANFDADCEAAWCDIGSCFSELRALGREVSAKRKVLLDDSDQSSPPTAVIMACASGDGGHGASTYDTRETAVLMAEPTHKSELKCLAAAPVLGDAPTSGATSLVLASLLPSAAGLMGAADSSIPFESNVALLWDAQRAQALQLTSLSERLQGLVLRVEAVGGTPTAAPQPDFSRLLATQSSAILTALGSMEVGFDGRFIELESAVAELRGERIGPISDDEQRDIEKLDVPKVESDVSLYGSSGPVAAGSPSCPTSVYFGMASSCECGGYWITEEIIGHVEMCQCCQKPTRDGDEATFCSECLRIAFCTSECREAFVHNTVGQILDGKETAQAERKNSDLQESIASHDLQESIAPHDQELSNPDLSNSNQH